MRPNDNPQYLPPPVLKIETQHDHEKTTTPFTRYFIGRRYHFRPAFQ
jgi:hypothetical protein